MSGVSDILYLFYFQPSASVSSYVADVLVQLFSVVAVLRSSIVCLMPVFVSSLILLLSAAYLRD